jgi:hypothetical protein
VIKKPQRRRPRPDLGCRAIGWMEQNFILDEDVKMVCQASVQSILLYGAETWILDTQQANKLLATEMDFLEKIC